MWKIAPAPNATQRFKTCYQAQTFGAFVILSGPKILPVSETVVPMRKINLRLKFLLLSILPLVLAAAAISYLVFAQAERLAEVEIRTF